jgi:crossover junction endodeoxyribonuclease RusA
LIGIDLPWPARPLWANWRGHWAEHARAIGVAKQEAWVRSIDAKIKRHNITRPMLRFQFHPPSRRLPDLHNMPHTQKAAIDGIALALGIDDNHILVVWPMEFAKPIKGGKVTVTIESIETVPIIGTINGGDSATLRK